MKTCYANLMRRSWLARVVICCGLIFSALFTDPSWAIITGVNGLQPQYDHEVYCGDFTRAGMGSGGKFVGNACDISPVGGYVPHSGYYTVVLTIFGAPSSLNPNPGNYYSESSLGYFDAGKPLSEQDVHVSSNDGSPEMNHFNFDMCYSLKDSSGKQYALNVGWGGCNGHDIDPIPPTPPAPDISCTLNNGNVLDVNLETVERAQLPTTPGGSNVKHVPVDINCTGGVDVSVNMQLNYTPISMTGTEVVKTTSNGLGVAILYNDKPLSSTDITPVTLATGLSTLDLAFEAVRDPAVNVGDIPTGAFSASATLIMTQQ